ncbi:alginate lyase family protein [Dyadobacter sp. BHUBP1]|uniref:alginate lyase family protein n=1 Tax=Dyadobacter sp. BHUBP1 TaxID=3424178 RepID=UPI003D3260A2
MGWHYVVFRAGYWLQAKTGILKLRFPRKSISQSFVSRQEWLKWKPEFLFDPQNLDLPRNPELTDLKWRVRQIRSGRFCYFSGQWFEVSDWHTNPCTGYCYPKNEHWSDVNDFSTKAGDIKYAWEKSRFTFLYDLIRYDFHFSEDQSTEVFGLIADWIDRNPVNCGPNWKCSQEIALRVLNWIFALHYYRSSTILSQSLLDKILGSIYDQMRHVARNTRFSEIAVKNNHVLTEALGLFTTGLMFPFFPESQKWKEKGRNLFETEIISQVAPDGSYLQYSMNYHRIVVQLLTWGLQLAELNDEWFSETVYEQADASLRFLRTCMDETNGSLPHYGHDDGALFFPLSECHFRDFRPQLIALESVLYSWKNSDSAISEEKAWLVSKELSDVQSYFEEVEDGAFDFHEDGYFVIRDKGTITFLRCGNYRHRPFQADNNHLDIWINGRNILRDAGTWLYNADEESVRYFSGTRGHNTIMIGDFDQMKKQHRFIWTHWIRKATGKSGYTSNEYWIEAEFEGFRHVGKGIVHKRRVVKKAGQPHWVIEDSVQNVPKGMPIRQLWHPDESFGDDFRMFATDKHGNEIPLIIESGWYSKGYGERAKCEVLVFETFGYYIRTVIEGH